MTNIETMKLALRRAFNLGQTYWQQADSEYSSHWKKADVTKASFEQLVEETCQAIEQAQQAQPCGLECDCTDVCKQDNYKALWQQMCERCDELDKQLAQQAEPVAWPKTPSDISNMIGSSFVWREHKISDVEPHEEDKYCVTAHDLLESFEHWSGYTSPPPLQPEPVIDKSAAIRIATALGWTPPRQPEQCQCPKCKVVLHASDCAVHSEPAYPKGECNCGATKPEPVAWIEHHKAGDNLVWDEPSKGTPLYTSPQKQPPVIDKSVARRIASQLGWEPPRQPLTDEQWQEIANLTGCLRIEKRGRDAIMRIFDEAAYGIKGEA